MLEKQAQDRNNERNKREKRAQDFMNKMADSVLQKMANRQKYEDDMLARYNNERELRMRQIEEKRAERIRQEQEKMRSFLSSQMEEKRKRENDDKSNIDIQAKMWETDNKNWEEEETRLKNRIRQINQDNQQYLLKQMAEKGRQDKGNKGIMHTQDFLMNKPLLREINEKLKSPDLAESVKSGAKSTGVPAQAQL